MTDAFENLEVSNVRTFDPYPSYKPSTVEWLGTVPEHWATLAIKRIVSTPVTDGPHETPEFVPDGVPFVSVESVWDGKVHLSSMRGFISNDQYDVYSKKYLPRENDVLIVKSGSTTGKVAIVDFNDKFNVWSPLAAIRSDPTKAVPKFVFYAMCSEYFQSLVRVFWSFGTQPNIGMEVIENLPIVLPPLADQRHIAAFLDCESAKIDTLIGEKRAVIGKLKEKRSALISRTVTRGLPPQAARAAGLDPHPPLKSSCVEWLGDVPQHWDVMHLKWAITFQRGHDLPTDEREEGKVPLVSSSGISATHSIAIAKGPGIVTGRYGTIGEFYLIEEDYWPLNTTLYSIDLHENEPRFLTYMLTNLTPLFLLNAIKSAVPGIDRNDIHEVTTAVPPLKEQTAIAEYLDTEASMLDSMLTRIEAAIERVLEYRTALITAAVTGKIDVRGVVA